MHPPDRSWNVSERIAKELHHRIKEFRREWAQFALKSRPAFDAFRDKGAALPDDFLDRLGLLVHRKETLHQQLQAATAGIPGDLWQLSDVDSDLDRLEQDLEELRRLCRQQEERFRAWLKAIQLPLKTATQLQTSVAEVRPLLSVLHNASSQVVTQLEDIPSLDCDQAESIHDVVTPLLHLVADQQWRTQPERSPTPLAEVEQWVAQLESADHRSLAIAALRGDLTLPEPHLQNFARHAASPSQHASSVTADQIVTLKKNLVESHDRVAHAVQPAPSAATAARQTRTTRQEAAAELQPVINALSHRRQTLQETHGITKETTDHPHYLRAVGLENLTIAVQAILHLLQAREANNHNYRPEMEEAAQLLAEAQSAVREDYQTQTTGPRLLPEQETVFRWLKHFVSEDAESILIARFMKRDGGADPADNLTLAARLKQFDHAVRRRVKNHALQRSLDSLVRNAGGQTAALSGTPPWPSLQKVILELLATGMNPTSAVLRDQLLKVIDVLPDYDDTSVDLHADFRKVLEHAEDYQAEQIERSLDVASRQSTPTAELLQVQQWLKGKTVALVAGVVKPEHRRRIEAALQLKSLVWIPASKSDRVSDLRHQLRDTSLVIFVTKLMGHKHSDLRKYCEEQSIPWVQTKKSQGYGVNVLVDVIRSQASHQLNRAG